jgi:hypothetical protein
LWKNEKFVESEASLFCEYGIPEGTVHGWMKEENKLSLFVDSIEDTVGQQNKKIRLCEHGEVDKCLCK